MTFGVSGPAPTANEGLRAGRLCSVADTPQRARPPPPSPRASRTTPTMSALQKASIARAPFSDHVQRTQSGCALEVAGVRRTTVKMPRRSPII